MKILRDTKIESRKIELTLNRNDIIELIHKQWGALQIDNQMDNIRIYFTCPNYDVAGDDIDIDDDRPIKVFIERTGPKKETK
jgi:hypothetical protein